MSETVDIRLTKRERELILKYGYPFEEIERQLRDTAGKRSRAVISDNAYWWAQVVGNLSISINEDVEDAYLSEELDELCSLIEWHLEVHKRGSGDR